MKRIFPLLLLLAMTCTGAFARERAYGFCTDGGKNVATSGHISNGISTIGSTVITSGAGVQGSFPSCTVTVFLTGTQTKATLFSNNSGTSKTNPFTAASDGYWFFYADDGRYDVQI